MGNCLVTKLKGTVNNSNLLKMGEMIIKGVKPTLYSDSWKSILVKGTDLYLDIVNVSDGADIQFCNRQGVKSGTHKEGNELDFYIGTDVTGASCDIIIGSKYSINYWKSSLGGELDCADLSWENIVYFDDTYSYKINVDMLKLANAAFISIDNYAGSFDLASLAGTTNLTSLAIRSSLVHGNISNIAGNTNLETFIVNPKFASITGDISAFQNTKVPSLLLHSDTVGQGKVSVYGDLSTLPSTCHFISLGYNPNMGKFTWGGTKSGYRLGINGASFSSGIDAMLNNQATLDSYTESQAWQNGIMDVASDVEPTVAQSVYDTIKTKGISTISINGTSH